MHNAVPLTYWDCHPHAKNAIRMKSHSDCVLNSLLELQEWTASPQPRRTTPENLCVEMVTTFSSLPRRTLCLHLSIYEAGLLTDLIHLSIGDSAILTVWNGHKMVTGLTGFIVRAETMSHFKMVVISFDPPHLDNPDLKELSSR